MADWVTISSLATAGGTLVLAVATFSSVRSASRSTRLAERSLLSGLRPLLVPSREDDSEQRVRFGDEVTLVVEGHGAAVKLENGNVYMGIGLRNGGAGMAVIHSWRVEVSERTGSDRPDLDEFHRQQRDLYIPSGDVGFWQGAVRDRQDPAYDALVAAASREARLQVDVLYGDYEGGQRTIARFGVSKDGGEAYRAEVVRYWSVDEADPR